MIINATYDASVVNAPSGYKTAIQSAINFFQSTFTNNISINLTFSYGNLSGGIAQSETSYNSYTYTQVITALKSHATSADDNTMLARLTANDPLSNPTASIYYNVSSAQAKALGLANNTGSDGTVKLGSGVPFTYDPNNRAVAGQVDAIGTLAHEISEIMGRSCGSDGAYYKTILGLSRFSSAGVLDAASSYSGAYFSVDGKTMLNQIGEQGSDLADWGSSVSGDAFGYASTGVIGAVTATDLRVMDICGYTLATTTPTPSTPTSTPTPTPVPTTTPTPTSSCNGLDYIASYSDLIKAFGTNSQAGAAHFTTYGIAEGRKITFNGLDYIASYADLIKAFGANEQSGASHFIANGSAEHRSTSFNGLDYIASYSDLIKAFGSNDQAGASHFITNGINENRSTSFNGLDYIASYGDLIKAFGANEQMGATHYINNGNMEARKTTFDGLAYIAQYTDLMKAFGANDATGAAHYITNGVNEHRTTAFNIAAYESAHTDLQGKYATNDAFLTAYINTYATTGHYLT